MDEADEKALDRIHEHKRHYDIIYVYRFNYAMVAQSMLLVSYATLLSVVNKTPQSHHRSSRYRSIRTAVHLFPICHQPAPQ